MNLIPLCEFNTLVNSIGSNVNLIPPPYLRGFLFSIYYACITLLRLYANLLQSYYIYKAYLELF